MNIASALIVDDSKMARITLKKQLESKEIAVFLAKSGEESLDLLKSNHPDIIFMDCLMPGIDGFEATRQIQSNPDTSSIPIVMCTGKETDEDKQKASELGAVGYMIKSSSSEPLHAILDEISHRDEHINDPTLTETESVATVTSLPLPDASEMTRMAEQSAREMAASVGSQLTSDLNSRMDELTARLEQKVVTSAESASKDIHRYVDAQMQHIHQDILPAVKDSILSSLTDSMENSLQPLRQDLERFRSEVSQQDMESLIEQRVQQQLEQHLPAHAANMMQDVVSRTEMGSMIQEQLSGYQARLDTLEQMLAAKLSSLTDTLDDSIENSLQPLRQDLEGFRTEVNRQDTGRLIEQQVQQQLEQHWPAHAANMMQDVASRTQVDSMIQEQLAGYQARLDTLEQMSALKSNSNLNKLGLFALLTGAAAIGLSVYQLLQ